MSEWEKAEPSCVVEYKIYYEHKYEVYESTVKDTRVIAKSKCSICGTIKQHTVDDRHGIDEFAYKE